MDFLKSFPWLIGFVFAIAYASAVTAYYKLWFLDLDEPNPLSDIVRYTLAFISLVTSGISHPPALIIAFPLFLKKLFPREEVDVEEVNEEIQKYRRFQTAEEYSTTGNQTEKHMSLLVESPAFKQWLVKNSHKVYVEKE